ncbi:hypothetical protein A3A71_01960 [Candidatus Berkelbacteria bacterium RIFCSPLOWO2_01_FULL_50_28]|uniref:Rod shape-determining protein RodA n=1 Tax=Candidatus Berkelbacteria bacterium RIFCSPLOWO2_01_FULL_50_28 TaxID=1797471 RepID=A0A1F5EBJ5_9BACT|nr:MAG: hypothetical protein A3F39_00075 [Candidatus Berkelbacteria bacterium RIFCSPHIGHO2_12_FULL_50_11]OGD64789.1 MAG: hypothetical protein A3A71_01960 [Candidatus Berkelbacteria bacterium RIFCSPLOWO2_01_FULL_50_28]
MWRRLANLPIDWLLLLLPILLSVTGIVTVYTITYSQAGGDFAPDQIKFALIGLVLMLTLTFYDYRFLRSYGVIFYVLGLALLLTLLPFIAPSLPFTLKIYGAYRWLDFGAFQLQPSELFKFIAAVFGAAVLANYIGRINWRRATAFIVLALVPVLLTAVQPDLGTASVLFIIFLGIFFAALPPGKIVIALILATLVLVPIGWSNLQGYQKQRIETFLNPSASPSAEGYNVRQSVIAIGSGGLTGRGFGQGSQTALSFLPVAYTDFVFAGFAEATGLVGSSVLLLLYGILIWRIIMIARETTDPFAQLLAIGFASKFLFQMTVHVGMNMGLLPVTGIPLPFMSYGGTALVIDLAAIGILQSIHIRHKKINFR